MEQFEAWLLDHGVTIVGQAATGSGDMLRFQLRLVDGAEFAVSFSAETLLTHPDEAISRVQRALADHFGVQRSNGV
jgi:hypothetical protein